MSNLLLNENFDTYTGTLATNWALNIWASGARPQVTPIQGSGGQQITIRALSPGSGVIFFQPVTFAAGRVYRVEMALSADTILVQLILREASAPFRIGAIRHETVASPTVLTAVGGYDEDVAGVCGVRFLGTGTVTIHSASLTDITDEAEIEPPPSVEITSASFGGHINKLGTHNEYPAYYPGIIRLWDTATGWADNEPTRGAMSGPLWGTPGNPGGRLMFYLNHIQRHDRNCEVLLTLAITPRWAAPSSSATFYTGTPAPPDNLTDWQNYIRHLGTVLNGRVTYWEILNECDQSHQYKGTVDQLVELARVAYTELKAINPNFKISSPNITCYGLETLDRFLQLGGNQYIDFVSWHYYPTEVPERGVPLIMGLRDVLSQRGISVPIYNTEGRVRLPEQWASQDETNVNLIARAYVIQLAHGIQSFSWYMWDDTTTRTIRLWKDGPRPYVTLSRAGEAILKLSMFLKGKRVVSKHVQKRGESLSRYTVGFMDSNGKLSTLAWSTDIDSTRFLGAAFRTVL